MAIIHEYSTKVKLCFVMDSYMSRNTVQNMAWEISFFRRKSCLRSVQEKPSGRCLMWRIRLKKVPRRIGTGSSVAPGSCAEPGKSRVTGSEPASGAAEPVRIYHFGNRSITKFNFTFAGATFILYYMINRTGGCPSALRRYVNRNRCTAEDRKRGCLFQHIPDPESGISQTMTNEEVLQCPN